MGTGTKTPALSTQPRVISLDRLLRALPTYCCLSNACLFCDKVPPLLVILVRSASAQERAEELEGQGPRARFADRLLPVQRSYSQPCLQAQPSFSMT